MTGIAVAHTADVGVERLGQIRTMLEVAFAEDPDGFSEQDWTHCLGGMHAWVEERDEVLAHACVVQRSVVHDGRIHRCGYVEGVAVRADHRGRGLGAAVMQEVERVIARAHDLGMLWATTAGRPLYLSRGWRPWQGPLSELTTTGIRPSNHERGFVLALPGAAELNLQAELTIDLREGDAW